MVTENRSVVARAGKGGRKTLQRALGQFWDDTF